MQAPRLEDAIAQYGDEAFLLTVGPDGPHTSSVRVRLHGNTVTCALSRSAGKNIASEPHVSLFWAPPEKGGYALIANGTASMAETVAGVTTAKIALTKSVFHRAGPRDETREGPCTADCQPIRRAS